MSPVRKASEDVDVSYEGPRSTSEEVDARFPKSNPLNRVPTSHMKIMGDREVVNDAIREAASGSIKTSPNSLFSRVSTRHLNGDDNKESLNSTAKLIERIIAACEDDKRVEERVMHTIHAHSQKKNESNINNKSWLDCDISSVDPSHW